MCLALVKRCVLMYGGLPSFHDIVRPLRALLTEHLAIRSHPRELQVRPLAPGRSAPARPFPDGEPVSRVLAIGVALIEDPCVQLGTRTGNRVTVRTSENHRAGESGPGVYPSTVPSSHAPFCPPTARQAWAPVPPGPHGFSEDSATIPYQVTDTAGRPTRTLA